MSNKTQLKRIICPALYMVCCCLLPGLLHSQLPIKYGSGGALKSLQANMDIRHYTLNLDIDITGQSISGFTEIKLELINATDTLLFNLYPDYTLREILVDDKHTPFQHTGDSVLIVATKPLSAGTHAVTIKYQGKPPVAQQPPWLGGFTWTKDSLGNPWVVINCQMEGGKIYFPCKDHPSDEPNEGADLYITIPDSLSVAGPGLLQSVKKLKKGKATWHWKTNYTISNYCLVFNIAKYTVAKKQYTTINGNKVPIEFYVLKQDKAKAAQVLEMRARDTRILEKYFGEYPWVKEKMGIAEVPNYGMEHQTMISYGGENFNYTHYNGFDYSGNLFHEFAHEWFANKVTNKDWAHFWIQEGITTYAEALFCLEMLGENGYDSAMNSKRIGIANKLPVVQGEGLSTAVAYNGDIYDKGAMLMHTLRYLIGDSLFFPALKALSMNVKYPYDTFLVSNDVEQHFSLYAHKDLKPVFDFYLYKTGTMDITVIKTEPGMYALYAEHLPGPLPFDIMTDAGIQRIILNNFPKKSFKDMLMIKSNSLPIIDPRGWYLKRVIYH